MISLLYRLISLRRHLHSGVFWYIPWGVNHLYELHASDGLYLIRPIKYSVCKMSFVARMQFFTFDVTPDLILYPHTGCTCVVMCNFWCFYTAWISWFEGFKVCN